MSLSGLVNLFVHHLPNMRPLLFLLSYRPGSQSIDWRPLGISHHDPPQYQNTRPDLEKPEGLGSMQSRLEANWPPVVNIQVTNCWT